MKDLIEALQIFLKYENQQWPTGCEHDVMYVYIKPEDVSEQDIVRLEDLGFGVDVDLECFRSYRFGSS